jgi:hypothetical protein
MKLKNHSIISALIIGAALMTTSCGDSPKGDDAITESEVEQGAEMNSASDETMSTVHEIFYAVPSPMEMASILKKTGAAYDMNLLNDVKKVHDYTTASKQALNLGVYGADLSYASIFNQNQEAIIYLSCTKKLADQLGVTKAFDDNTIARMEANVENRDSLLNIVSETYYILDSYLKENGRDNISAMVIAGGWVEGLYLATTIATQEKDPNELLFNRVAEQKISLSNLQELVQAYNSDNSLESVIADLNSLEAAFSSIQIVNEKPAEVTKSKGETIIGGKTTNTMTEDTLEEIHRVVTEIRTRYVS